MCHCTLTYRDLLFIQVCSDPAPMHCSKVQGKMQSPLFNAVLQNRLTAGSVSLHLHIWRFALHTGVHRDVPFIQVCRDPHQLWSCSTARGKMQFPISCVAVQDRLTACIVSLQIHLWRLALRTGVQGSNTNAHTGVQ